MLSKEDKLTKWIEEQKQLARDNKEEFFLSFPDSWYADREEGPSKRVYADVNGHISHTYLISSVDGDVCLECRKPVHLVPPTTTEEILAKVLK